MEIGMGYLGNIVLAFSPIMMNLFLLTDDEISSG